MLGLVSGRGQSYRLCLPFRIAKANDPRREGLSGMLAAIKAPWRAADSTCRRVTRVRRNDTAWYKAGVGSGGRSRATRTTSRSLAENVMRS